MSRSRTASADSSPCQTRTTFRGRGPASDRSVGIRALKQNASAVVARTASGESLGDDLEAMVTDDDRLAEACSAYGIAVLVPA